jgi:hypothetical protein
MVKAHVGPDIIVLMKPAGRHQVVQRVGNVIEIKEVCLADADGQRLANGGGHRGIIVVVVPASRLLFKSAGAGAAGRDLARGIVERPVGIVAQAFQQFLAMNVIVVGQLIKGAV